MTKRGHRSGYKAGLRQLRGPGVGVAEVVGGVSGGRDVLLKEILRHLGVFRRVLVAVRFRRYGRGAGAEAATGTWSSAISALVSKIHLLQHCHSQYVCVLNRVIILVNTYLHVFLIYH